MPRPMESKPYTPDDLKEIGTKLMKGVIGIINDLHEFRPSIILIGNNREVYALPFDPEDMNNPSRKARLFNFTRHVATNSPTQAVIIITDMFTVYLSEAELERSQNDQAFREAYHKAAIEATCVDDLVAAGFGVKASAIFLLVQSPTFTMCVQQPYVNDEGGGFSFKPQIVLDSDTMNLVGNMRIWGYDETQDLAATLLQKAKRE